MDKAVDLVQIRSESFHDDYVWCHIKEKIDGSIDHLMYNVIVHHFHCFVHQKTCYSII